MCKLPQCTGASSGTGDPEKRLDLRGGKTEWTNVVTACEPCNLSKSHRLPRGSGIHPLRKPYEPSNFELQENGRTFPPNYLHESWRDFLYWDTELDPA